MMMMLTMVTMIPTMMMISTMMMGILVTSGCSSNTAVGSSDPNLDFGIRFQLSSGQRDHLPQHHIEIKLEEWLDVLVQNICTLFIN